MWLEGKNSMKNLPDFPFKCPKCGEEIRKWADLGCHWSDELHCPNVKKCPKPPRGKRALMRLLREICGVRDGKS